MKSKVIILSILLLCISPAEFIFAQTIVGPPAVGEVDLLSTALASASSGAILVLQEGVYVETNTISTILGDLTIRGADGAEVIIYGPMETAGDTDMVHVKSENLWLENLIFVGSDSSRNAIVNYYGGCASGDEGTVEKNNIYVSNCQFYAIDKNCIIALGTTNWDNEIPKADDDQFHPIDTLRVTDSYFYGGNITNERAIITGKRQARYVEVRRSTFWSLGRDAVEVKGFYIGSADANDPLNNPDYNTAIVDHLTIFNTYNDSPDQAIGEGGDGIHFEYANRTDIISNSLVLRSGRFCFKAKRGYDSDVCAMFCIGDSANVSGDYSPPTVFYWDMCTHPTSFQANPLFVDPENGDFSLQPLSDAVGSAHPLSPDGPNRGDPHWNDPITYWPNVVQIDSIIARARAFAPVAVHEGTVGIPMEFILRQNHPNPFNPTTIISYSIPLNGVVNLAVYSVLGRRLATLVNDQRSAGHYAVSWNATDDHGNVLPSGVYIYRISVSSSGHRNSYVDSKKMLFIR